jgi:hypothetical protein
MYYLYNFQNPKENAEQQSMVSKGMAILVSDSETKHVRKRKNKMPHKNDSVGVPLSCSTFDESFKYYKRRCPPPDLSQLLNVNNPTKLEAYKVILFCKKHNKKNKIFFEYEWAMNMI